MAEGMELHFFGLWIFKFRSLKFGKNRSFCGISGIFLEISASEKYFSDSGKWPFHTPPIHTPTKCRPIIAIFRNNSPKQSKMDVIVLMTSICHGFTPSLVYQRQVLACWIIKHCDPGSRSPWGRRTWGRRTLCHPPSPTLVLALTFRCSPIVSS